MKATMKIASYSLLVAVAAVLLMGSTLPLAADNTPVAEAGSVITLQGTAFAEANGVKRPLSLRAKVFAQDTLVTGENSRLEVMFKDRTIFYLGPNSKLVVAVYNRAQGQANFRLMGGVYRMVSGTIVRQNPEGFTIATPVSTVGIRGTMTAHEIGTNGIEHHYVLDLSGDHTVIVESSLGLGGTVMRRDFSAVDVTPEQGVGRVRPMTEGEIHDFSPEGLWPVPPVPLPPPPDGTQPPPDGTLPPPPDGTLPPPPDGTLPPPPDGTLPPPPDGTILPPPDGTMPPPPDGTILPPPDGSLTTFEYVNPFPGQDLTANVTGDLTANTINGEQAFFTHRINTAILLTSGNTPLGIYHENQVSPIVGTSSLFNNGVATNGVISGGNPTGVTDISNYSSPVMYSWSGSAPGWYNELGHYTRDNRRYLDWGVWNLDSPGALFDLTNGGATIQARLTPIFVVQGELTPPGDLSALRNAAISATYTGTANGVYSFNSGVPQALNNGAFSCGINFGTDVISGAAISFPSNGISLTGGNGALAANGTFSANFSGVTTPGAGNKSANLLGATFGPGAAAVGGEWNVITNGNDTERITGEFSGHR